MTKLRHTFFKDKTTGVTFTTLANMFLSVLSLTSSKFKPGSLSCTFRVLVNKKPYKELKQISQRVRNEALTVVVWPTSRHWPLINKISLQKFVKFINEVRRSPPQSVVRYHRVKDVPPQKKFS